MKKRAVLFALMLVLVSGMLSLTAFAAPTEAPDQEQTASQSTPATETDVSAAKPAEEEAPAEPAEEIPETIVPQIGAMIALSEADMTVSANVASLNADVGQRYLTTISGCNQFPIVFDLSALPEEITVLILPQEVMEAINTAYQAAGADTDAIKVITQTYEYLWSGTKMQELAAVSAPTVMLALEEAQAIRRQQSSEVSVEFAAEDDQEMGILIVSKNAMGEWQVTQQNLYTSVAFPILMLVALVLVMLVAIVAVNLIIIKIYRSQM